MMLRYSPEGSPSRESGDRGTILVIEDLAPMRRTLAEIFRRAGYRTLEAENGTEALRLLAMYPSEIVAATLDLDMPETDGRTTLARMSDINAFLPILIVTGLPIEGLQGRIPGTPGVKYVPKPFFQEQLLTALRVAMDEMKHCRVTEE
jgi:CheY-like chemotaxis protein